eukprot:TRINITY_DN10502_c0_g1_i12.p1 TRINITY_DN10502_c0_g1~~TRINITY_DN10502_c0_g1_i12.p1  ORF type:complete len:660 (-),score=87.78 TRINITY_DN10502_c0_g1_i12:383-2263(-)
MNPDTTHNSCSIPEEEWPEVQPGFQHAILDPQLVAQFNEVAFNNKKGVKSGKSNKSNVANNNKQGIKKANRSNSAAGKQKRLRTEDSKANGEVEDQKNMAPKVKRQKVAGAEAEAGRKKKLQEEEKQISEFFIQVAKCRTPMDLWSWKGFIGALQILHQYDAELTKELAMAMEQWQAVAIMQQEGVLVERSSALFKQLCVAAVTAFLQQLQQTKDSEPQQRTKRVPKQKRNQLIDNEQFQQNDQEVDGKRNSRGLQHNISYQKSNEEVDGKLRTQEPSTVDLTNIKDEFGQDANNSSSAVFQGKSSGQNFVNKQQQQTAPSSARAGRAEVFSPTLLGKQQTSTFSQPQSASYLRPQLTQQVTQQFPNLESSLRNQLASQPQMSNLLQLFHGRGGAAHNIRLPTVTSQHSTGEVSQQRAVSGGVSQIQQQQLQQLQQQQQSQQQRVPIQNAMQLLTRRWGQPLPQPIARPQSQTISPQQSQHKLLSYPAALSQPQVQTQPFQQQRWQSPIQQSLWQRQVGVKNEGNVGIASTQPQSSLRQQQQTSRVEGGGVNPLILSQLSQQQYQINDRSVNISSSQQSTQSQQSQQQIVGQGISGGNMGPSQTLCELISRFQNNNDQQFQKQYQD